MRRSRDAPIALLFQQLLPFTCVVRALVAKTGPTPLMGVKSVCLMTRTDYSQVLDMIEKRSTGAQYSLPHTFSPQLIVITLVSA